MKINNALFLSLFSAAILCSCGENKDKELNNDSIMVQTETEDSVQTPVAVSFDELLKGDYDKKLVVVEGYFVCPSTTVGYDNYFTITFYGRQDQTLGSDITADLKVGTGSNTMNELPKDYKSSDFAVRTDKGETLGERQRVKITGIATYSKYEKTTSVMVKVSKIEKAEDVSLDYTTLSATKVSKGNFNVDSLDRKLVYAEGVISSDASLLIPSDGKYMMDFVESSNENVKLNIPIGTEEGQMLEVPDNFSKKDIKILDNKGKAVGSKRVRVYGVYRNLNSFGLIEVEEIIVL